MMKHITEVEIFGPQSLLGKLSPMVVRICANLNGDFSVNAHAHFHETQVGNVQV